MLSVAAAAVVARTWRRTGSQVVGEVEQARTFVVRQVVAVNCCCFAAVAATGRWGKRRAASSSGFGLWRAPWPVH